MSPDDLALASHWLYAAEESFAPRAGESRRERRARREQRERALSRARAALLRWMEQHGGEEPSEEERRICEALGEKWPER